MTSTEIIIDNADFVKLAQTGDLDCFSTALTKFCKNHQKDILNDEEVMTELACLDDTQVFEMRKKLLSFKRSDELNFLGICMREESNSLASEIILELEPTIEEIINILPDVIYGGASDEQIGSILDTFGICVTDKRLAAILQFH